MNFRSVADLNRCISRNLCNIPRDVDLIVGIPRSGLLAANLIALHLNLPLTDLDGLCQGRLLSSGKRLGNPPTFPKVRRALVVDDSIWGGSAMAAARARIDAAQCSFKITYAAVYSSDPTRTDVDLIFEHCECPRIFEWNMMHHSALKNAGLDIDGVLCVDPTTIENDDGDRYIKFLRTAKPLHIPSVPVKALISSRLKKYQAETEFWLRANGVQYQSLYLLDLPTMAERQRLRAHASFKAEVIKQIDAEFFIESDPTQAVEIAAKSGRPVISLSEGRLVSPSMLGHSLARVRSKTRRASSRLRSAIHRFVRKAP